MTAVTYDTLYSAPSENIFSMIDTRTNVADPRDPQGVKNRKFVYSYEPKAKATDFSLYPYIVCEDASMAPPTNQRVDHKIDRREWTHRILVRVASNGSGNNRTDQGHTDMKNIVDDILKTFNDVTNRCTLRTYEQRDVRIYVIGTDLIRLDQLDVYETELELSYNTYLSITA